MIYAIAIDAQNMVKIGVADDPLSRLVSLQCGSPFDLRMVATCEGSYAEERLLHRIFAPHRVRGEWFGTVILTDLLAMMADPSPAQSIREKWQEERGRICAALMTDTSLRQLLAEGAAGLVGAMGPTSLSAAIGCDEKTVRRTTQGTSILGLAHVLNWAAVDPEILNRVFAAVGLKLVPIDDDAMRAKLVA